MSQQKPLTPGARIVIGAIVALAGLPMVLAGLGMLPPDPKSIHAPLWVILCAGLAFMLAGATVALGAVGNAEADGTLTADAPFGLRLAQYLMGLSIVGALALVESWVAFGPGERNFKSAISFLGMSQAFVADEMIGRALFGIAAVLFWVFLIAVARKGWRKLFAAR